MRTIAQPHRTPPQRRSAIEAIADVLQPSIGLRFLARAAARDVVDRYPNVVDDVVAGRVTPDVENLTRYQQAIVDTARMRDCIDRTQAVVDQVTDKDLRRELTAALHSADNRHTLDHRPETTPQ